MDCGEHHLLATSEETPVQSSSKASVPKPKEGTDEYTGPQERHWQPRTDREEAASGDMDQDRPGNQTNRADEGAGPHKRKMSKVEGSKTTERAYREERTTKFQEKCRIDSS